MLLLLLWPVAAVVAVVVGPPVVNLYELLPLVDRARELLVVRLAAVVAVVGPPVVNLYESLPRSGPDGDSWLSLEGGAGARVEAEVAVNLYESRPLPLL